MEFNKDSFITGEPVDSPIGKIRFLTVSEYMTLAPELNGISLNNLHIYWFYHDHLKKQKAEKEIMDKLEDLKNLSTYEIILSDESLFLNYVEILKTVLYHDNINEDFDIEDDISTRIQLFFSEQEIFDQVRKLILDMNLKQEEPVSSHPMIQEGYNRAKRFKENTNKNGTTFNDIITTVVVGGNMSFAEATKLTVLQLYAIFYRIAAFKEYEATLLYSTIPTDDPVEVQSWSKHIDLWEQESTEKDAAETKRRLGGMF